MTYGCKSCLRPHSVGPTSGLFAERLFDGRSEAALQRTAALSACETSDVSAANVRFRFCPFWQFRTTAFGKSCCAATPGSEIESSCVGRVRCICYRQKSPHVRHPALAQRTTGSDLDLAARSECLHSVVFRVLFATAENGRNPPYLRSFIRYGSFFRSMDRRGWRRARNPRVLNSFYRTPLFGM